MMARNGFSEMISGFLKASKVLVNRLSGATEAELNQKIETLEAEKDHYKTLAEIDGLTGLYNRRTGDLKLHEAIKKAFRDSTKLGILLIDLDGFKFANDTYGHDCGDEILKTAAKVLQSVLRKGDIVARLGGDEFKVVIQDPHDVISMRDIAERMKSAIKEHFIEYGVTASIGAVLFNPTALPKDLPIMTIETAYETCAKVFKKLADNALYYTKGLGGKDGVCVAYPETAVAQPAAVPVVNDNRPGAKRPLSLRELRQIRLQAA